MFRLCGRALLFTLSALGFVQCAKLERINVACGNHVIDPGEDCDGTSSTAADAGGRPISCATAGSAACHYTCDNDVNGKRCPSDDWKCLLGVCVAVTTSFGEGVVTTVQGPIADAFVADFDRDGSDDIVTLPISFNLPATALSAPGSTHSTTQELVPVRAMSRPSPALFASGRDKPYLVANVQQSQRYTTLRAAAHAVGSLEFVPYAIGQTSAARVDFLPVLTGLESRAVLWVHGSPEDTLRVLNVDTGELAEVLLPPLQPMPGERPDSYRAVAGVPPDSVSPCSRIAVATESDSTAPSSMTILTVCPTADAPGLVVRNTLTLREGAYPLAGSGILVGDVDGDGAHDLAITTKLGSTSERPQTVVLYGPFREDSTWKPLFATSDSGQPLLMAMGQGEGGSRATLVTCASALGGGLRDAGKKEVAMDALCSAFQAPVLEVRVPDSLGGYVTKLSVSDRKPVAAGLSDLNGDGWVDLWTWFGSETGFYIYANSRDGYLQPTFLGYDAITPLTVRSGQFDQGPSSDLVSLLSLSAPDMPSAFSDSGAPNLMGNSANVVTIRGLPDLSEARVTSIARATLRSTVSFLRDPSDPTEGLVQLAQCNSVDCNSQPQKRVTQRFGLFNYRNLGSDPLVALATFAACRGFTADAPTGADPPRGQRFSGGQAFVVGGVATDTGVRLVSIQPQRSTTMDTVQSLVRWVSMQEGEVPTVEDDHDGACQSLSFEAAPDGSRSDITWDALVPSLSAPPTDGTAEWIALSSVRGAPVGFSLYRDRGPVSLSFEGDRGDNVVRAEPIDIDGDGDTDFLVMAGGTATEKCKDVACHLELFINAPCRNMALSRCFYVKRLEDLGSFSHPAYSIQRSKLEETYSDRNAISHRFWFASVSNSDLHAYRVDVKKMDTGEVEIHRVDEPEGKFDPNATPVVSRYARLAWGDFDGDGVLDLLHTEQDQATVYSRAVR